MDGEDRCPAFPVGPVDHNLAVKAASAQQRRVQDFRPVCCGEQYDPFARIEAVELRQKLVQRLLLFVVTAIDSGAAPRLSERVELVDEDDARRRLARLFEEVAYARSTDADEHFHELRSGDREERHARLAGDGLGDQRLTRAGGTDQQHAFWNARAQATVFVLVLQEGHDLLQLGLGFVDSRHVIEGHACIALNEHARL